MTPKLKYWLYDNHWVVSALLLLVVFSLWAILPALRSWSFLYPSVGAVLGLSYFVLKQHLEDIRLFKELFSAFTSRFDKMNERLYELLDGPPEQTLTPEEVTFLYDYFNLCAEEYLYYRKGFIYPEVWLAWIHGMRLFYASPRIRALWKSELQTGSYYGFSTTLIEHSD